MVLLAEFGLAGLRPEWLWWKRSDTTGGPRTCLSPATLGQVAPATRRDSSEALVPGAFCASHPPGSGAGGEREEAGTMGTTAAIVIKLSGVLSLVSVPWAASDFVGGVRLCSWFL